MAHPHDETAAAAQAAVAAVALSTPRLHRDGDWVRVRVPPVRDADRLLRAVALRASEATGVCVRLHCGGLACAPAGSGAVVQAWLEAQQPGALAVARACAPAAVAKALVACDERGVPASGRACAVLADELLIHCSDRPNPVAVAAVFGLPSHELLSMHAQEPDGVALAAADAYVYGRASFGRWRAVAAKLAGGGAAALRRRAARAVHAPRWGTVDERLARRSGCDE